MNANHAGARYVAEVADRMQRLLQTAPDEDQGDILANLLGLFIASHFVADEMSQDQRPETAAMRETMLEAHMEHVRKIIPDLEKLVLTQVADKHH
jgi:hypothetical protein